ncbi:MAG: hypothetical protein Aurels2KO_01920 [Aureliella sp.]
MNVAAMEKADGNIEKSQKYVAAVNQLGDQLRQADITLTLKQLGAYLATLQLDDA